MRGGVDTFEDDGRTFLPPDRRLAEDRRSLAERREGGGPPDGEDQRQRHDRRSTERRVLRFGILYTMSRPMAEVEDWLENHCDGGWSVMLEDLDERLERKTIRVLFEDESDKRKFKNMVQKMG